MPALGCASVGGSLTSTRGSLPRLQQEEIVFFLDRWLSIGGHVRDGPKALRSPRSQLTGGGPKPV